MYTQQNCVNLLIFHATALDVVLHRRQRRDRLRTALHTPHLSAFLNIKHCVFAYSQALDLIYYFTAGEKEVRCWTVLNGSLAPQAAGVIHSDFERGFIKAEVVAFDDFKSIATGKSMAEVKAAGKYRQVRNCQYCWHISRFASFVIAVDGFCIHRHRQKHGRDQGGKYRQLQLAMYQIRMTAALHAKRGSLGFTTRIIVHVTLRLRFKARN